MTAPDRRYAPELPHAVTGCYLEITVTPTPGDDPVLVPLTTDDVNVDMNRGSSAITVIIDEAVSGLKALGIVDDDGKPIQRGITHHRVGIAALDNPREDGGTVTLEYAFYGAYIDVAPVIFPIEPGVATVDVTVEAQGSHGFEGDAVESGVTMHPSIQQAS